MPGFGTHRALGLIAGLFISGVAFFVTLLTTLAVGQALFIAGVAYGATVIGSVIPDIDLSQPRQSLKYGSIPYKGLVKALRVGLVVVATLAVLNLSGIDSPWTLGKLLLGLAVVLFGLVKAPDILHRIMPRHRGKTHQMSWWVVSGVAGILVLRDLFTRLEMTPFAITYLPPAIALPLAVGAACHIALDVVVSAVKKVLSAVTG